MIDNSWAVRLPDHIFNMFAHEMRLAYGDKYPNLYITQDEAVTGTPKFPTVLMRQISSSEKGRDIEGDTVNGINPTFEVKIRYQGESQSDRDALVNMTVTACNFFTWKKYNVSNVIYVIENKIRTASFKATRTLGSEDSLQ